MKTAPPMAGSAPPAAAAAPARKLGLLLAAIFVVLALGISTAGLVFLRRQTSASHRAAHDQLAAIAELKVGQILRWYRENIEDAGHVQDAGLAVPIVRDFLAHPEAPAARTRVCEWLASLRRHYCYDRLVLLDARLQVRLADPGDGNWVGPLARTRAVESLQSGQVLVSDLHRSSINGQVNLDLLVPLIEPGRGALGVLVIEILPTSYLYPLLQYWPTRSATGETLLVRREGDEVVFLNELRHRPDSLLALRVPLTRAEAPEVRAVLGEEGIVEGLDYRGRPVLGAPRRIPGTPWFLVAKVDQSEIDEPLRAQVRTVAVAMVAMIAAAGLGVGLIWRQQKAGFLRRELTDRIRFGEVLQASEAQMRSIYTAMTEMVVLHEIVPNAAGEPVDYRILDCNETFVRITGIPRDRAVGALASVLFGTGTPPYLEQYARVALTGEPAQLETFFPPLKRHFAISIVSPRRGQFATVTADITERKNAQAEREGLLQELARKNEELESMIYVASHDLRAPLVNIQGFGHRLELACAELTAGAASPAGANPPVETPVSARVAKALHYIRTSAEKMETLINGLLRVSRLGRVEFAPQQVDVNAVLSNVLATLEYQVQQAAASVRCEPLPACQGDPQLLGQVFGNLLDNALKYRVAGRPLRVEVTGRIDASEAIYCVADTGQGIAREHQDKIWEMFHRLYPEGPVAGEGLGLKVVRRILDRHGGRIWVESQPGVGSRFYVALPVVADASVPT